MPIRSLALSAVLLAAGALLTWLSADPGRARALRQLEALAALAVGWAAFAWFDHSLSPADASNEPFMIVVNCLFFGLCFTAGTGSSVVLDNGAVWPDLLLAVRHFGGAMSTVRTAVLAMAAAGVALVFLVASRFARPALAAPTAVLTLGLMSFLRFGTPLLDCSITLLFSAASAAALLHFALSGRRLALAAAALFASHAFNAHPSTVILLPALLLVAAMAGRPALPAAGLAIAVWLAAGAVTSAQGLVGNWGALGSAGLRPWVFVGALLVAAAGAALNPAYRRLSGPARGAVVGAALVAPYAAGVLVLLSIRHEVHARYSPPVIPPLAVAATLLLAWPARRLLPLRFRHWGSFLLPMAAALVVLHLGPTPNTSRMAWQLARTDAVELPPEKRAQLTPEGHANLRRLAECARRGDLGETIRGAGFRASFQGFVHDGALRLDLARRDGSSAGFMLLRPPMARRAMSPRHFVLYPDDGIAVGETRRLAAVLDEVFTDSPWAGDPRTFPPRLHMQGPEGEPVGATRAWLGVLFLVASTAAGLAYLLWCARPPSEAETLVSAGAGQGPPTESAPE